MKRYKRGFNCTRNRNREFNNLKLRNNNVRQNRQWFKSYMNHYTIVYQLAKKDQNDILIEVLKDDFKWDIRNKRDYNYALIKG